MFTKYVDDIFAIVPRTRAEEVLQSLNSFHPKLKFTMEEEIDNRIPYLDVLVIRGDDGIIETDWYKKNIASDRILNYYSNHPEAQKLNTARNFISRVLTLSSQKFHGKNKISITDMLTRNNYPPPVIRKLITRCMHTRNTHTEHTENTNTNTKPTIYRRVTYVRGVSEKIEKVVKAFTTGTKLAYSSYKCLRNVHSKLKDPVPKLKRSNLIYRIPCLGDGNGTACNQSYVGQTKQYLGSRLQNHKRDLRKVSDPAIPKTALMDHFGTLDHYPDFSGVEVLATQRNLSKRLTTEALHIYTHDTYNIKRDTDDLAPVYCALIDHDASVKTKRKRHRAFSSSNETPDTGHTYNNILDLMHPTKRRRLH